MKTWLTIVLFLFAVTTGCQRRAGVTVEDEVLVSDELDDAVSDGYAGSVEMIGPGAQ